MKYDRPLTVSDTCKLIFKYDLIAALPCCATALIASIPFFLLTLSDSFSKKIYKDTVPALKISKTAALIALILFILYFIVRTFYLKHLPKRISLYPYAFKYTEQQLNRLNKKTRFIFPALLLCIGTAFSVCISCRIIPQISLTECYITEFFSAGLAVFLTAHMYLKKRYLMQTKLISVPDTDNTDRYSRKKELRRKAAVWSVYWLLIIAAYLILSISFGNWILYCPIPAVGIFYFAVRLFLNNPLRPFSGVRGRHPAYIAAELAVMIAITAAVQAVITTGYSMNKNFLDSLDYSVFQKDSPADITYDKESGVYTLSASNDKFRILQLTDIHIGESITTVRTDRKALTACYELIKEAMPDLIVVTGDIAYAIPTMTFSSNNLSSIGTFTYFMNKIGIPWIMTYGNHDNEPISQYRDEKTFEGLFRHYQSSGESAMLYSDKQPDIYGRYNQYIQICNSDGSLNRIIFLIDSNDYVRGVYDVNKYDSVHDDQIRWYSETTDTINRKQGRTVPSFVFMHIPFRAFADAQNGLEQDSDDAVYLFGKNEEKVSCPDNDSGFFDAILEKKSTQAVFVGHDHLNNMAVRYRGVDLVYSKSIDYVAYPKIESKTDQRGATLITLSPDGDYEIGQLSYNK